MNAIAPHPALDLDLPLACEGLKLAFDRRPVLRGVDLQLHGGEILALLGRNGAGKSSLINCLLGLMAPDAGQARVLGAPALGLGDVHKRRLGYVPQQPEAFAWLRIGELFGFLRQLYPGWDQDHAGRLLRRWDLDPGRNIGSLSPGQRQALALVRALALRPALLVLDEPASALDPVARRQMLRELVDQATDAGISLLFSSHIVSDLERVASEVAILHQGRIVLHQPLDELKECAVRLGLPAGLGERLPARLPGEVSRRARPDQRMSLVLTSTRGCAELLGQEGVQLDRLALEDLFVEIAG
jgi:ABC-2 type transport system ATP-binding protein